MSHEGNLRKLAATAVLDDAEDEGAWVVSDERDGLFGQVLPRSVVDDPAIFQALQHRGVVYLKGTSHFVTRQAATSQRTDQVMEKYGDVERGGLGVRRLKMPVVSVAFTLVLLFSAFTTLALFGLRRLATRSYGQPANAAFVRVIIEEPLVEQVSPEVDVGPRDADVFWSLSPGIGGEDDRGAAIV